MPLSLSLSTATNAEAKSKPDVVSAFSGLLSAVLAVPDSQVTSEVAGNSNREGRPQ